jgi:hypothetical protein
MGDDILVNIDKKLDKLMEHMGCVSEEEYLKMPEEQKDAQDEISIKEKMKEKENV